MKREIVKLVSIGKREGASWLLQVFSELENQMIYINIDKDKVILGKKIKNILMDYGRKINTFENFVLINDNIEVEIEHISGHVIYIGCTGRTEMELKNIFESRKKEKITYGYHCPN